jgi:hypothetical protein
MQNINKRHDVDLNNRYTLEEYLAETNIKNKEEAKAYLRELRITFWVVFLCGSILYSLNESDNKLVFLFFIFYVCFSVYFIYFCFKLLKIEKIPTGNAWFCIIFAPISWLYLYPLLANPLKIILGEKQPPIRMSGAEKQKIYEKSKRRWGKVSVVLWILTFLWLLGVVVDIIFF